MISPFCGVEGCSGETCSHNWCRRRVHELLMYLSTIAPFKNSKEKKVLLKSEEVLLTLMLEKARSPKYQFNNSGEESCDSDDSEPEDRPGKTA